MSSGADQMREAARTFGVNSPEFWATAERVSRPQAPAELTDCEGRVESSLPKAVRDWHEGLHFLHCREDRCGDKGQRCDCPCHRMGGRSTPVDYADCADVTDATGRTWRYSEPTDTWGLVTGWLGPGSVAPQSARSWQRLLAEFGPVTS